LLNLLVRKAFIPFFYKGDYDENTYYNNTGSWHYLGAQRETNLLKHAVFITTTALLAIIMSLLDPGYYYGPGYYGPGYLMG